MKLQLAGRITKVEPAFGALYAGGLWVFRSLYEAYACDDLSTAPVWLTALDNEQSFLVPRTIYSVGDLVLSVEDFGADYRARVVALALGDGALRWEQKFELQVGMLGFAVLDDRVLVHGRTKEEGYKLFQLEAATGKIISSISTEQGNGVCAVAGRIYLPTFNGLFVMEQNETEPRLVMPLWAHIFSHDEGALYILQHEGGMQRAVVYVDGETAEERGKYEQLGEGIINRLVPLREPGRVLVLTEKSARVLDLVGRSLVSTLDVTEGWTPISAASTLHGLSLLLKEDSTRKRAVAIYDAQTGRALAQSEVEGGLLSNIFYLGERVVVCGTDVLFFRLSDDENDAGTPAPSPARIQADAPPSGKREHAHVDAATSEAAETEIDNEQNLTEQQKRLKELIDLFIECMQIDPDSAEYKECGRRFNGLFKKYMDENSEESLGTFASRISSLGVPYEQAFADLMHLRIQGADAKT